MDGLYRQTEGGCPRCGKRLVPHGERKVCAQCGGAWIGDAELVQLVYSLAPDFDASEPIRYATRKSRGPIRCPRCNEPLRPVRFAKVPLDRCDKDGAMWLDGDELRVMLENLGLAYAERERARDSARNGDNRILIPDSSFRLGEPSDVWRPALEPDPPETGFVAWVRRVFGKPHEPEP